MTVKCDSNKLDLDFDKLREKLPAGFPDSIPDQYKNISAMIPQKIDEGKKMFKEKCKELTGDDKVYERIELAFEELKDCIMPLVNVEELQKEIEEAQPTGELDIVFNK